MIDTPGGRTFTSLKARSRAAHVDDLFPERLARSVLPLVKVGGR